jgi:hypothetical protein
MAALKSLVLWKPMVVMESKQLLWESSVAMGVNVSYEKSMFAIESQCFLSKVTNLYLN